MGPALTAGVHSLTFNPELTPQVDPKPIQPGISAICLKVSASLHAPVQRLCCPCSQVSYRSRSLKFNNFSTVDFNQSPELPVASGNSEFRSWQKVQGVQDVRLGVQGAGFNICGSMQALRVDVAC